ncbi:KH domain-containing protein [Ditylenchus destructor]|nr:KH domain-containing protein [Ditylenchus destructor]
MDYLGGPLPAATSMAATAAECFLQQQRVQSNLQHSDMNGYKYGNGTSTENHATITDGVALASPSSSGGPQVSVILTIRLLMQGKEVGSIIGKRGDHVKLIRDKSSAKVNISDGSCPERIVTITGNTTTINAAFAMVARKFEEDLQALPNSVPKPPITMRLIVPATQCGSLIGKGGSKIKEIREKTGASIQVATEMLPSSTERAVTISGTCEAITDCMQEICQILLEAPPKGATLPFRPKPSYNPLMVASSAAAAAAAQQQASQHIVAAAFLQQQQQPQTQLNPYGNALANSAPMPVVSSSLGSLQQELSKFPFSLAPDGSIIPTSAVARSQILNLTSSASDVSGLIGSMPLGSGLTNFVGFPTATHPFHTPVSAALFVQGVHPNIGQTSNAGMLAIRYWNAVVSETAKRKSFRLYESYKILALLMIFRCAISYWWFL